MSEKKNYDEIYRSKLHENNKSHDVLIIKTKVTQSRNPKTIKMTYESYYASERFSGEIWDGTKWEHFFSMIDLGVLPQGDYYVKNASNRVSRCEELQSKGIKFITILNQ